MKAGALLAVLPVAAAWPAVMKAAMEQREAREVALLRKRQTVEPEPREPLFLSGRPNTSRPPVTFNAEEQFVSVDGDHEFQSPGPSDIRGQCPGLNAAANHNYLPRNGLVNTQQSK